MIRHLLSWQFIRFILVGILNTAFSYLIFAALIFTGLHYAIAVLLAAVLGALFNFKTIGSLVFKSGTNSLLYRFLGVYLVCYVLNVSVLRVFSYYEVSMYLAGLIVALPMAVVSFSLLSRFVYAGNRTCCDRIGR